MKEISDLGTANFFSSEYTKPIEKENIQNQ
jgi:hypothetical protein